jgi:hypothetical protein
MQQALVCCYMEKTEKKSGFGEGRNRTGWVSRLKGWVSENF